MIDPVCEEFQPVLFRSSGPGSRWTEKAALIIAILNVPLAVSHSELVLLFWSIRSRALSDPRTTLLIRQSAVLYTFILWAVIAFVLLLIVGLQWLRPTPKRYLPEKGSEGQAGVVRESTYSRAWRAVQSSTRKWLLPEGFVSFFGNVTRLQIFILAFLLFYLLIFS